MKVLVALKRVADPDNANKVKIPASGDKVDTSALQWKPNPFDEYALEAALRLTENGKARIAGDNVTLVSFGPKETTTNLRQGLAMGADPDPGIDWASHTKRVLDMVDNQVRALRKRQRVVLNPPGDGALSLWADRRALEQVRAAGGPELAFSERGRGPIAARPELLGDVVLGLASSGVHSNGYSLVRKILEVSKADLNGTIGGKPLADVLMAPTRIYIKPLLALIKAMPVHALAHITGGGLPGNLPRVLPEGCNARIDETSWTWPPVFQWLQENGGVERFEMYRTFNCGVGMVVVVPADKADTAIAHLNAAGESAWRIGEIIPSTHTEPTVVFA